MKTPEEIKEYQRQWREANKEKRATYAKKYHKQWYKKNKEKKLKQNKEWAERNPEKRKEIWQRYYDKSGPDLYRKWRVQNRKKCVEATQRYVEKNYSLVREKERKWRKSVDGIFARYQQSAKRRGLSFKLSRTYFQQLLEGDCYYCGGEGANGIDRFDNSRGYSKKNSVSCCTPCNMMKKTLLAKDFVAHATRIAKHNRVV